MIIIRFSILVLQLPYYIGEILTSSESLARLEANKKAKDDAKKSGRLPTTTT